MNPDARTDWLFIRYNRNGKPISDEVCWKLFRDLEYKFVAKTVVGHAEVSTVWLGMNHAFEPDAPPLIFETKVFGQDDDMSQRYSTEAEALRGHAETVRRVRGWRFWVKPQDVLAKRITGVFE